MQVFNGQQGPAIVLEAGAECEKPQEVGLVAELHDEGDLIAIQHAGIHEGGGKRASSPAEAGTAGYL